MYNQYSILYCNKNRPTETNGPDGYLYVLSSEDDGAVLYRIS
ncbi:MAG: PQQ-dependent sugar dehydrogenase [Thaumarchaeota archaeon]|nr:MAG: PQQ-dependent sugar dehydrogenase [Nitrososphaerota archaeon]